MNNFVNALGIRWNLLSYALNRLIRFGRFKNNFKRKEEKIAESGALTFEAVVRDWQASCSKNGRSPIVNECLKS
mgnify:CR=1 FL=1